MTRVIACLSTLALAPALAGTSPLRDCDDCPEMIVAPAGSFYAGSPSLETTRERLDAAYAAREQPRTQVKIAKAFAVSRYPVTRGEYARFVQDTARSAGACSVLKDGPTNQWGMDSQRTWMDPGFEQDDRHPVVCVNFDDAVAYVAWLSARTGARYRLPTGHEWEYAARAGVSTARLWGDDRRGACEYGNVSDASRARAHNNGVADAEKFFPCDDGYVHTSPVGAFKPNAFGLYDALGNVWEWTSDCLETSLSASSETQSDPRGDCSSHIDRGASWTNSPKYARLAARHPDRREARTTVLGFRVVREID